jgi:hypothetical protein
VRGAVPVDSGAGARDAPAQANGMPRTERIPCSLLSQWEGSMPLRRPDDAARAFR